MIVSPFIISFEVTELNLSEEFVSSLSEKIRETKPELGYILTQELRYTELDNLNYLIVMDVILVFNSETLTKAIRTEKIAQFKEVISSEFKEYFTAEGILFRDVTVD